MNHFKTKSNPISDHMSLLYYYCHLQFNPLQMQELPEKGTQTKLVLLTCWFCQTLNENANTYKREKEKYSVAHNLACVYKNYRTAVVSRCCTCNKFSKHMTLCVSTNQLSTDPLPSPFLWTHPEVAINWTLSSFFLVHAFAIHNIISKSLISN